MLVACFWLFVSILVSYVIWVCFVCRHSCELPLALPRTAGTPILRLDERLDSYKFVSIQWSFGNDEQVAVQFVDEQIKLFKQVESFFLANKEALEWVLGRHPEHRYSPVFFNQPAWNILLNWMDSEEVEFNVYYKLREVCKFIK